MTEVIKSDNLIPELQDIAAQAAAADATGQPEQPEGTAGTVPEPEAAQPSQTPEQDARQIVDLIAWTAETMFPVLGYNEATKDEGAKRLAPLLVKYNLQETIFGSYGAEIQAGMFFGGLVFASAKVVKDRGDEAKSAEHRVSWFAKFFKWGK